LDAPAQVLRALRRGRARRAVQDDLFLSREDPCHLRDGNDEEKPAEEAGADGEHVRSIAARCVPHLLDHADPALGRIDAKTVAASKPVVDVRSSAARTRAAASHRTSFRLDSLLAQSRSRSANSGLPSLDDYFSLWRYLGYPNSGEDARDPYTWERRTSGRRPTVRTIHAVKLLARDGRIPRPLRWRAGLGLLAVPEPFDEAVLFRALRSTRQQRLADPGCISTISLQIGRIKSTIEFVHHTGLGTNRSVNARPDHAAEISAVATSPGRRKTRPGSS
jgi:hypothetical protein